MTKRTLGTAIGILAVLALVATPATAAQDQNQREIAELGKQGRELVASGQHQQALELMNEAIEEHPDTADFYFVRGYALGNLGRHSDAQASFLQATELAPTWPMALNMVALSSYMARDMEVAWDYAVRAHLAGFDTTGTFQMLEQQSARPDDLDQRMNAARIFVDDLDVEGLLARNENPFGRAVDTGSGIGPDASQQTASAGDAGGGGGVGARDTTTSRATGVGNRILAESQADLNQLVRQTRISLGNSANFGLVPRRDMASLVLSIEIDDMAEGKPRRLEGYIRLYDARNGEEVYKRILELRDVSSVGDLNADIERYVDYLEEWAEKRAR